MARPAQALMASRTAPTVLMAAASISSERIQRQASRKVSSGSRYDAQPKVWIEKSARYAPG